jgi:hypothetical protein
MQEVPRHLTISVAQGAGGFQQASDDMSSVILQLWPWGCGGQRVKKGFARIVGGTGTPIRVRIEGASAS